MKNSLLTLTAVCFLLIGGSDAFAQTGKKKLVKCFEKGKVVYRAKCKTKKPKPVADVVKPTEKYGDPNSKFEPLDGTGTGGGQGVGRGSGVGTGGGMGSGTGQGTGSGTGVGSGRGSGSGTGTDDNTQQAIPKPPTTDSGGNTALKILSKPRAESTEESRKNQVQGTVTLRVTFLADGTIGTVSPISGLPDGLTAQAIEAAKKIKFEPAKKNGKPIAVTKTVQYTFILY